MMNIEQFEQFMVHRVESQLCFVGSFDELPATAHLGDVCVVDGMNYVWNHNEWIELGNIEANIHPKIKYPSNCKNCGAVLHSNECEYCGTNNEVYV